MLKQYNPQRFHYENGRKVGSIAIGSILYIQSNMRPVSFLPRAVVCREPWIVESWHNREYHSAVSGQQTRYLTGGHLATVRSLRTGETRKVADWMLLQTMDAGLDWYPKHR